MFDQIVTAIRNQQLLRIEYDPGMRLVEPHAFGRGSSGQLLLRVFQTEGASQSGEHKNWKLFRVDRVSSLDLMNENFDGPRPGYKKGDKVMANGIIEEL